jgi:hypothetical protein
MNATAIFGLISQGLALLPVLIEAGIDITKRIEQLRDLSKAAAEGTVTDAQIALYRSQLDNDLADFNAPMV